MAAQRTNVPLLDLQVESVERQFVRIDGKDYELRRSDDFTIEASNQLSKRLRSMTEIVRIQNQTGKINRVMRSQLDTLLKEIVGYVLAAPPSVLRSLKPVPRFRIVNVFQMRSLMSLRTANALVTSGLPKALGKAIDREVTGIRSSLDSSGSTAAIRSRGSRSTRKS